MSSHHGVVGRRYLCCCVAVWGDGDGPRTACKSNVIRGGFTSLYSRPADANATLVVPLCGSHHDGLLDRRSCEMWCLASSGYFIEKQSGSGPD